MLQRKRLAQLSPRTAAVDVKRQPVAGLRPGPKRRCIIVRDWRAVE
jgi:hypothetical protein